METDQRPIGVFDSGIGGLTVLKDLRQALPAEHLIYLADLAHSPYGMKSPETVRRYVSQITRYLLGRDVKLIVIACNTALAAGGELIRALSGPVPVVGVVSQASRAALRAVSGKRRETRIGVLATRATVGSNIYPQTLRSLANGFETPGLQIRQTACPLFVPLAEEGLWEGELADLVVRHYLGDMEAFDPHAVILGCTHYPLLRQPIARALPETTILVESGPEVALEVRGLLEKTKKLAPKESPARTDYWVSDSVDTFRHLAGRILDSPVDLVHHVDLDACEV